MTRHPSSEGEVEEAEEARGGQEVGEVQEEDDREEVAGEEDAMVGLADEEVRGEPSLTNWL